MEHDHMIEALAPNGTNHPLHIGSLPRRSRRAEHFLDTHISHLSSEVITEDRIAVAQQVARELVKGEGFPQLLSCWKFMPKTVGMPSPGFPSWRRP